MGFMDKVKEVGNQAASQVNQAVNKGQAQFDSATSKRHADALLRDLGALTYAQSTGRGDAATESEIARVTAELQAHEAGGGVIDLAAKSGATPPPPAGTAAATPPPPPGAAAATPPPPAPGAVAPPPAPGTVAPPPPPGAVGGS